MRGVAACAWPNVVASSHPGRQCAHTPLRRRFLGYAHFQKPAKCGCRCRARSAAGVRAAQEPVAGQKLENSSDALPPPSSRYTKAERRSLADIPESEMSPEMLRRWRISKANKGKQPWNLGRRHSAETLDRIQKGTLNAMKRPEVLAKVRQNHPAAAHTEESKARIGAAVAAAFKRKRERELARQVANPEEAARKAQAKEQARLERLAVRKAAQQEAAQERARLRKLNAKKPLTPLEKALRAENHRKAISRAIKAKWKDPEYRTRVSAAMRGSWPYDKRVAAARERTTARQEEAQQQLQAAIDWQEKLDRASDLVRMLQQTVEAGQAQAEALRGDPAGFARQQQVLDNARQLVMKAQIQVATLEGNMPNIGEMAQELDYKTKTSMLLRPQDQEASSDQAPVTPREQPSSTRDGRPQDHAEGAGIQNSAASRNTYQSAAQDNNANIAGANRYSYSNGSSHVVDNTRHPVDRSAELQSATAGGQRRGFSGG